MNQPSEKEIIEALEESGYLFEQDVATLLEDLDFHVETSYAYTDLDQDKSREIDIRAFKETYKDESNKVQIFVELLVECKDFGSPLVFLERIKNEREAEHSTPQEYIFPAKHYRVNLDKNSYREEHPFQYFNLKDSHYYYKEKNKATQFSKIYRKNKTWSANHEGIYDTLILPLAKLLEVRKKAAVQLCQGSGRAEEWKRIWLFFPMVVLRDHLYSYEYSTPTRKLAEKERVSFVRQLDYSNLKGFYLIDFVKYDHLNDYVCKEIANFTNSVIDLLKNRPNDLLAQK